jgi:hypothetical protein
VTNDVELDQPEKSNIQTESTITDSVKVVPLYQDSKEQFIKCFDLFEWFGDDDRSLKAWSELTPEQRNEIESKIPSYVASTPNAYRDRVEFQLWINPKGETNTFRQWNGEKKHAA